jgi:hypothetical protein
LEGGRWRRKVRAPSRWTFGNRFNLGWTHPQPTTTTSPVGNDVRKVRISPKKIEMLEIEWNYEIIDRILYEQV